MDQTAANQVVSDSYRWLNNPTNVTGFREALENAKEYHKVIKVQHDRSRKRLDLLLQVGATFQTLDAALQTWSIDRKGGQPVHPREILKLRKDIEAAREEIGRIEKEMNKWIAEGLGMHSVEVEEDLEKGKLIKGGEGMNSAIVKYLAME